MGELSYLRLAPTLRRAEFHSGDPALDVYLKERAMQDARRSVSATYVGIAADSRIACYYSLAAASIELARLPARAARRLPRYPSVPATLLARLAVDLAFRGQHAGEQTLFEALRTAVSASLLVGSAAILVEPKAGAVGFYQKYGFTPFVDTCMYLPMGTARRLLDSS